jgi:hypothetical protein
LTFFILLVPVEDAFYAGVAFDQAFVVVVGMVPDRLDGDEIPRIDGHHRLEFLAEVTAVDSLIRRGDVIVVAHPRLDRIDALRLRGRDIRGIDKVAAETAAPPAASVPQTKFLRLASTSDDSCKVVDVSSAAWS